MKITNGQMGPVYKVYRIPAPIRAPQLPAPQPVKQPEREPVRVG